MGFVDGTDEIHYVNGVFDDKDGCAGDLTQNNYPFKLGARARGTGMATSSDADASAVTDNGSRFYGEIDEAMVFNKGVTGTEAAGERNCGCVSISFSFSFRDASFHSHLQSVRRRWRSDRLH